MTNSRIGKISVGNSYQVRMTPIRHAFSCKLARHIGRAHGLSTYVDNVFTLPPRVMPVNLHETW